MTPQKKFEGKCGLILLVLVLPTAANDCSIYLELTTQVPKITKTSKDFEFSFSGGMFIIIYFNTVQHY